MIVGLKSNQSISTATLATLKTIQKLMKFVSSDKDWQFVAHFHFTLLGTIPIECSPFRWLICWSTHQAPTLDSFL